MTNNEIEPAPAPTSLPNKSKRTPYVIIILALGMLAMYFTIAIHARTRHWKMIQATHQEFLTLQQDAASQSEWEQFKEETHAKIDPIIKSLEETVSSDVPHQQHLLWAARDYLYPMLDNARTAKSQDQDKFEKHLKAAEETIYGNFMGIFFN